MYYMRITARYMLDASLHSEHGMLLATHANNIPCHILVCILLHNTVPLAYTVPLRNMVCFLLLAIYTYPQVIHRRWYASCYSKTRTIGTRLQSPLQAPLARLKRRPYATLGHRPIGQPANFSDKPSTYPQTVVFLQLARPIPY